MQHGLHALISAIGLIVSAPLMLLVAVAIKLDSRGPVIFKQERIGRHLKPFRIYKFRTMVEGAQQRGPGVTGPNDPRVTRIGRVLRKTKLDELPQLWNVVKGDMNLVGPRPELGTFVRLFEDDFRGILRVRPGITDIASIAYRDESSLLEGSESPEETYVNAILPHKIGMAKTYVQHASLFYDLRLVLETILVLTYPLRAVERMVCTLGRAHVLVSAALQAAVTAACLYAAMLLRYGGAPPPDVRFEVLSALPLLVLLRGIAYHVFGLYRDLWKYVGVRELSRIVGAVVVGTVAFGLALVWPLQLAAFPKSILVVDAMMCILALDTIRLLRRVHHQIHDKVRIPRRVLVVGADDAVEKILRDLDRDTRIEHRVVGLVATDPASRGLEIHGAPILGRCEEVPGILDATSADEILVVASAVPEEYRKEVIRSCRASGMPVRVIPGPSGRFNTRERELEIEPPEAEDLLPREPIEVDVEQVAAHFRGKRVMITGAGGSIGSEICRQIAACGPSRLVLFEKHEASLYDIERELRPLHPDLTIDAVIGDVRDATRVDDVLASTEPEVLFHAAAYKHVPMMEQNPAEAIKTNVQGTRLMADAADRAGVEVFVLISTDKAVEPVSVMGASKRLAELAIRGIIGRSKTRFLTVRFGNVMESSGSVIPLFKSQIESGVPLTVTHPDVTRWFMTVPEAVRLILSSVTIGEGGEVFVLDMGKPVRIVDLAYALIRQYGMRPGEDVQVVFTGLRPGERLFESLFHEHEMVLKTSHPRILKAVERANGVARLSGNGNGNGNGHAHGNGNGEGHANGHGNGNGNGNGNGARADEVRRLTSLVRLAIETRGMREGNDFVKDMESACA